MNHYYPSIIHYSDSLSHYYPTINTTIPINHYYSHYYNHYLFHIIPHWPLL